MNDVLKREYREGVEDGIELCLTEAQKEDDRKELIAKLQYFLGLVKERKLEELQDHLGVVRRQT